MEWIYCSTGENCEKKKQTTTLLVIKIKAFLSHLCYRHVKVCIRLFQGMVKSMSQCREYKSSTKFCKSRLSLVVGGVGQIQDRCGPHLLKKLLKRTPTDNNRSRSETTSLLSQLPRNTFKAGGCPVVLSHSTEAKPICSKGKRTLKMSILLFYFVPCDPAVHQTPVASIVSLSASHCSLAM